MYSAHPLDGLASVPISAIIVLPSITCFRTYASQASGHGMASLNDSGVRHDHVTPVPYRPGQNLRIQTLHNFNALAIPDDVYVTVGKVYTVTMSPVMDVHIRTPTGYRRLVLKLYDRRFGEDLRNIHRVHLPHTAGAEAAFQSFVRSGKMEPFLNELEKREDESQLPFKPAHLLYNDDDDGPGYDPKHDPERIAQYEAALWRMTREHFECETKAYVQLAGLQGQSIPRVVAHVRLMPLPGETEPDQALAPYLEVKGILLERIPGYCLSDLPISPLAPQDMTAWPHIIQTAVDAAAVINRRGILMEDCDPRNVLVDQDSQLPFIIDFAQCVFKEELLKIWEGLSPKEKNEFRDPFDEEDWLWDPEAGWLMQLAQSNNPGAIGSVTATIVRLARGIELSFRYPPYEKMALEARRRARGLNAQGSERESDAQSST